jgi:hypothetical protein
MKKFSLFAQNTRGIMNLESPFWFTEKNYYRTDWNIQKQIKQLSIAETAGVA